MKTRLTRSVVLAVLVPLVLSALLPATSARADEPVIRTFTVARTNYVMATCDGFDIIENSTETFRVLTFLDDAGNRVRRIVHYMYQGTLTNSMTGKTVSDAPDPQTTLIDYVEGTQSHNGLIFRITVPGEGAVLVDAGTIVIEADGSVTVHGRFEDIGDWAPLCAALE